MNKSLDMNSVNCGLLCIVLVVVVLCCMNKTKTTENFRQSRFCRRNCGSHAACEKSPGHCGVRGCGPRCKSYKYKYIADNAFADREACNKSCESQYD